MITCVCMNPAMDKTIELDGFNYGGLNRVKRALLDATGKAVNVAIVLSRLGDAVRLVGINYLNGGDAVRERLASEGVDSEFCEGVKYVSQTGKHRDEAGNCGK